MNQEQLSALLQLASPALPIGGFSYSQGLEAAVDCGLVNDAASAKAWIGGLLGASFSACEGPIWVLNHRAWHKHDQDGIRHWNSWFWASRETHELRMETEQMGWSLVKLAQELGWGTDEDRSLLASMRPMSLPCAHAYAAVKLDIPLEEGLAAYGFTWLENQVMAAIKTIPLGQVSGQKILQELRKNIAGMVEESIARANADKPRISTFAHQLAILSSRHETQYSRLFRS